MARSEGPLLTESRELLVRTELHGLLESATFRASKRCRDFLDYVVQHTLQGRNDYLKERSIGVELFELPPNFDAGQHTVVRVTANEVRKKLAKHYQACDGEPHPVRIELPPGSYRAEFKWPVEELAPEALPPPRRPAWLALVLALVLLGLAGAMLAWRNRTNPLATEPRQLAGAGPPDAPPAQGEPVRLAVGATGAYLDRSGRSWGPDRFFTGGTVLLHPTERIRRTLDPDLYRHVRVGEFRYDIPLPSGRYELHLHFAETGLTDFISAESSGEGQRVFRVLANGVVLLNAFDVVADADGANIADERVFHPVSPAADGRLHLVFAAMRGAPMVSAIELLPCSGRSLPTRIRSGWTASWRDSAGQLWLSDSYFQGGNALVRATNPVQTSNPGARDTELYASERWGHFSYAIPVAAGSYRLVLRFCEGHHGPRNSGGGGAGSRRFHVYCNGVTLLHDFDIFEQAGGEGRPLELRFSGIRPNPQGKILLSFVPVEGMACLNGIEVGEETN